MPGNANSHSAASAGKLFAATHVAAPCLWAAAAALSGELVLGSAIKWWHPYCEGQPDGPGSMAFGFPLPYAEPTGVSSMEFFYMPHVWLLNLALLAVVTYPLFAFVLRRIASRSTFLLRAASSAGLVVLLLTGVFHLMMFSDIGHAVGSISSRYGESYWSYRLDMLAGAGHRGCFYR